MIQKEKPSKFSFFSQKMINFAAKRLRSSSRLEDCKPACIFSRLIAALHQKGAKIAARKAKDQKE